MIKSNPTPAPGSPVLDPQDATAACAGSGQPAPELGSPQAEAIHPAIEEPATSAADSAAAAQGALQIEELRNQLAAAEDRVLRAHAELDNYRKRANRLLQEETKYAPLPLVRDLLPIIDNLDRAIQAADQNGGSAALLEGVKMVAQLLRAVLERHGCRRIEALGSAFDPHLHEAIAQVPNQQLPPGTVAEVALTGYQLHERVVRPAQVLVTTRPPACEPSAARTDAEATEN
jgi:molecular chaperone GrpE